MKAIIFGLAFLVSVPCWADDASVAVFHKQLRDFNSRAAVEEQQRAEATRAAARQRGDVTLPATVNTAPAP